MKILIMFFYLFPKKKKRRVLLENILLEYPNLRLMQFPIQLATKC